MSFTSCSRKQYLCKCFYTDNYFSKIANKHFSFVDKADFIEKNAEHIKDPDQLARVADELFEEQQRRNELGRESAERIAQIKENYIPLHPHVYILQESYLDPKFLELIASCKTTQSIHHKLPIIESLRAERVYALPVFTKQFCSDLLEELEHFEASPLPKGRPNTMNKFGILLDEVGMDENFLVPLRRDYLSPLASVLYPDHGGSSLDSHKAFTVQYKATPKHDKELGYHYDNAEVTLNVSLREDFEDGELYFGPMFQNQDKNSSFSECRHRGIGYGILHRGQHLHGALPISEGERHNLIIWMRSSAVRNKMCPMCRDVPQLVETEGRGDGFSPQQVQVCSVI